MPKAKAKRKPTKAKTKPKRETRDFSQIALGVVQQATGTKLKRR